MERILIDLDRGWRFALGDIGAERRNSHADSYGTCKAGAVPGPGGKNWDDSDWRELDLPHDYFAESDFSPDNLLSHGYRTRNNAWYRKTFLLDPALAGRQLLVCFEGTAVNAEFYFNGSLMARSFSAYTETVFDITDRAYFDGRPNVLAVRINGFETEGWWYEGAGIYRHVRLYAKNPVHIAHNGIFGKPVLNPGTKNSWTVEVKTEVENSGYESADAVVRAELFDAESVIASAFCPVACPGDSVAEAALKLKVSRPRRWDVDAPNLYTLRVTTEQGGAPVDRADVRIGFRTFSVDPDKGFFLNGRPLKIKGTCNHQDHAGVGVAVPDSVQYYRVKRLKDLGTNAYRCSHNLPAKEILDACDELGLIVMDENRRFEAREEVLAYLDIMVKRDRNHPSVVFWSLFNEEPLQNTAEGAAIYRRMKSRVLKLDDSRLITGAINGSMEGAGLEMDVTGINYNIYNVEAMHALHPDRPVIGSENNSAVSTRGCYRSDREGAHLLACYDEENVPWGQSIKETWDFTRKHDYFSGIFIWTGFDYRGEPTPFEWPSVSSSFGIMDTCGFPKDSFYFNRACFTDEPMIHILPHWNHEKGEVVRVMAATNCEEAELFLGNESLGRKPADVCKPPEWQVPFKAGRLTAKGYRRGKCVARDTVRTAGKPAALRLTPFRSSVRDDGADTAVVNVAVVDRYGTVVPYADTLIRFTVVGDGFVRGVGNGDPNSHESDVLPERHAYHGLCQVLVTSKTGADAVALRAEADGLPMEELPFEIEHVPAPRTVRNVSDFVLDGFTMSSVTEEKPDAVRRIEDNDMNSFTPVRFEWNSFGSDFVSGWRIFRVTPQVRRGGTYRIVFARMKGKSAEVFVDGTSVGRADSPRGGFATEDFTLEAGSAPDIRILMEGDGSGGCGIAGIVRLRRMD